MTTARQLYSLQELDLALEHVESQRSEAEKELDSPPGIEQMEAALQKEQDQLDDAQRVSRLQALEVESLRQRLARLEAQLYDGSVSNPRDLESVQEEVSNMGNQLQQRDTELLELSVQVEEAQKRRADLERALSESRESWRSRQEELTAQLQQLSADRESLAAKRAKLAATMDAATLQRYETLRRTKGGQAVARVERGLCQACRMSLPTQQLQRVRSGRQTVLCNSCGRMLFLG